MRSRRRPKLGQHFLTDPSTRRRILDSLDLHADDLVIEIGAGWGAMTELLAERVARVVAIEIDPALARGLKEKLAGNPRIEILEADVLSTDLDELCRHSQVDRCLVFGNLPYYIASPIIHHLRTFAARIRAMGLLVQREVAERLTAQAGTRDYGYLSILTQTYWRPRVLLSVPPGAFTPRPKVRSALVGFTTIATIPATSERLISTEDRERFLEFVKRCFAQKRKSLVNNLARPYARRWVARAVEELGWPAKVRAEQLTAGQLAGLFSLLTARR